MKAVKRFGVQQMKANEANITYYSLYQTQPLYFILKVVDLFGNIHSDKSIYEGFSVSELAISAQIKGVGSPTMVISSSLTFECFVLRIQDEEKLAYFNSLVPSPVPLATNTS